MKKAFVSFLIMTLTLTSITMTNMSSVQAATTDNTITANDNTIKVSLESIRDIVIENNLDIKIKHNELKIAKENSDDAKAVFNGKTKPAADAPKSIEFPDEATYKIAYDAYTEAVKEYNDALSDYEEARDKYKTLETDYNQKVESKVYEAQNAYLAYLVDSATQKINDDTLNYNDKKAQIYKLQYESGFLSKNQYNSKLQENTSVNDSNKSKNTVELDRVKLCNLLGISSEEKITINTDVTKDFQIIEKINYNDDLAQMLENNIEIKNQNDKIDDLEDTEDNYANEDIYDYTFDSAQVKLKQLLKDKETSFKEQYNALMASYNSIKSSYDVIMQKQKEYEITQIKYDYGFISKIGTGGVDTEKLTLDKANAQFIKDRNECYLKYLKYTQMKEGY